MFKVYDSLKRASKELLYRLPVRKDDHADYSSESSFWENHMAKKDQFKEHLDTLLDKTRRRALFPAKMVSIVGQMSEHFCHEPLRLLEVGSGPTSNLAWGVDEGLFKIYAIDPLADVYDELMRKHRYDYPIKPMRGTGEELLQLFDEGSFHICYSRNAIDHARSPKACIINMYKVLKTGGVLYLDGYVGEGTNQGWDGLHQHDLLPMDGCLYHKNKGGVSSNLTGNLNLKTIYCEKSGDSPGDTYTIIFKKF